MVQNHSRTKLNFPYRHFIAYSLLFLAVHTLAVMGFLITDYHHNKSLLKANESLHIGLLEKSIARDFKSIPFDVEFLLAQGSLLRYIEHEGTENHAALLNDLEGFLRQRRIYSAVYYLDMLGDVQAGVERFERSPRIIPATEYLNYSSHRFFEQVSSMAANNLYVSPIRLRVEAGEVVRPYEPMIRIATPLVNRRARVVGILILDYEAERLFTHFAEMLQGSLGHISLLNKEGYWLHAEQVEREWGFMFGNEQRFDRYFAPAWKRIGYTTSGQFETDNGIFSFATVYPLGLLQRHLHGDHETCVIHSPMAHDSYQWKIVSRLDSDHLMASVWSNLNGITGLWWVMGSLISFFMGWMFARWHNERKEFNSLLNLNAEVFNTTTNGVLITDPQTRIVSINKAFTDITGYSREDVLGHAPSILGSGKNDPGMYQEMWDNLQRTGAWEGEIWNRKKDGEIYPEWLHISVISSDDNEIRGYVGIFSDITEQKLTERQLFHRAHHDPLTALANRLLLDDRLKRAISQGHRTHKKIALLYLDLDRFKPINDKYGHHVGDVVLCEVARRLEASVREVDTVARVGGDEFMILLPEEESRAEAVKVAERVHVELNKTIIHQNLELNVGVSIGIALCPEDADEPDMLVAKADHAMYRTKLATRKSYTEGSS